VPVFKNARLVGQLGSRPRLVADRAEVVPAKRVRLTLSAGRQGGQGRCSVYPRPVVISRKLNKIDP